MSCGSSKEALGQAWLSSPCENGKTFPFSLSCKTACHRRWADRIGEVSIYSTNSGKKAGALPGGQGAGRLPVLADRWPIRAPISRAKTLKPVAYAEGVWRDIASAWPETRFAITLARACAWRWLRRVAVRRVAMVLEVEVSSLISSC